MNIKRCATFAAFVDQAVNAVAKEADRIGDLLEEVAKNPSQVVNVVAGEVAGFPGRVAQAAASVGLPDLTVDNPVFQVFGAASGDLDPLKAFETVVSMAQEQGFPVDLDFDVFQDAVNLVANALSLGNDLVTYSN